MSNEGSKSRKRVATSAAGGRKAGSQAGKRKTPAAKRTKTSPIDDRLEALEAECRRLQVELDTARAEIVRLEEQRDDVLNRIDWIVDSLHNVIEE
jgi:predicted RNase H-like nuclease (RuvC/YqgF family)